MEYNKTTWQDEIRDENNEIIQTGTSLSADNLNNMEEGIKSVSTALSKFFENGGTVNGILELLGINRKNGELSLGSTDIKLYLGIPPNSEERCLRPQKSNDLMIALGKSDCRWKDCWVGDYYRSTTGYSKQNNGVIEQWGTFTIGQSSNNSDLEKKVILFPISFPNKILNIQLTNVNTNKSFFCGKVIDQDTVSFTVMSYKIFGEASPSAFSWRAIGY